MSSHTKNKMKTLSTETKIDILYSVVLSLQATRGGVGLFAAFLEVGSFYFFICSAIGVWKDLFGKKQ